MAALFLFALSLLLAAPAAARAQAARTPDIHFTPTRHAIADAMLQLAGVTAQDVVYDLGSGDGRIPIIAAQKYGARGVGIAIDPRLVTQSWGNANDAQVANRVMFKAGDLLEPDDRRQVDEAKILLWRIPR